MAKKRITQETQWFLSLYKSLAITFGPIPSCLMVSKTILDGVDEVIEESHRKNKVQETWAKLTGYTAVSPQARCGFFAEKRMSQEEFLLACEKTRKTLATFESILLSLHKVGVSESYLDKFCDINIQNIIRQFGNNKFRYTIVFHKAEAITETMKEKYQPQEIKGISTKRSIKRVVWINEVEEDKRKAKEIYDKLVNDQIQAYRQQTYNKWSPVQGFPEDDEEFIYKEEQEIEPDFYLDQILQNRKNCQEKPILATWNALKRCEKTLQRKKIKYVVK